MMGSMRNLCGVAVLWAVLGTSAVAGQQPYADATAAGFDGKALHEAAQALIAG